MPFTEKQLYRYQKLKVKLGCPNTVCIRHVLVYLAVNRASAGINWMFYRSFDL